jgi:hypothetical protein
MATISADFQTKPDDATQIVFWEQVNNDDEGGVAKILPRFSDKSVHFYGTFNGSTMTLEHSMDNTNWTSAVDAAGFAIAVAAVGSVWVASNARWWRIANNNSGSAEDVDVYLVCGAG